MKLPSIPLESKIETPVKLPSIAQRVSWQMWAIALGSYKGVQRVLLNPTSPHPKSLVFCSCDRRDTGDSSLIDWELSVSHESPSLIIVYLLFHPIINKKNKLGDPFSKLSMEALLNHIKLFVIFDIFIFALYFLSNLQFPYFFIYDLNHSFSLIA